MDGLHAMKNNVAMKKKTTRRIYQPTLLREWRKHRNLTQESLASRVDRSEATISRLETQRQAYTQVLLEALAEALQCEPSDIISRRPGEPTDEVQRILERMGIEEQGQILGIVRVMFPDEAEKTG